MKTERRYETMEDRSATALEPSATAVADAEATVDDPTQSGVTRGTRAPVACERTAPETGF